VFKENVSEFMLECKFCDPKQGPKLSVQEIVKDKNHETAT